MLKIGDCVTFKPDNSRGIILKIENNFCQVIWEDYFVSLENLEDIEKDEQLTHKQRINRSSYSTRLKENV